MNSGTNLKKGKERYPNNELGLDFKTRIVTGRFHKRK